MGTLSFCALRHRVKKLVKFKNVITYLALYNDSLNPRKFWSFYKAITKTSRIPKVGQCRLVNQANAFNALFHTVFGPSDQGLINDDVPRLDYNIVQEISMLKLC